MLTGPTADEGMPVPDAAKLAALGRVLAKARAAKAHTGYTDYGPTVSTIDDEYLWHPLAGKVLRQVTPLTVGKRSEALVGWFGWLAKRQQAAGAALTRVGIAATLPVNLKPQKLPTGPGPDKPHFIDPFLWLVAGRHNTLGLEPDGTDQALAGLADPAGTSAAAAASPAVTTELLQQIRNLAEVYARWEAAATIANQLVHKQLAKPALTAPELVARVLALFRTEGSLTVLPESDTLDTSLQQDATLNGLPPLPPGRSQMTAALGPSYYTYCATYLTDQAKYAALVAAKKVTSVPGYDADGSFAITMAGMDIMWSTKFQPEVEACYPTTPAYDASWTAFDWMALNRQQANGQTHDAAVKQVTEELDIRLQMLALTTTGPPDTPGSTNRITATSAADYSAISPDPDVAWACGASGAAVGYLLLLLNQPAWYLDRLSFGPTRFGPGAPTRLPETIVYLLYHVGSEAPAMLASAVSAAANPHASSAAAQALRTALRQHGYNRTVAEATGRVKSATKESAARFGALSDERLKTLRDDWPTVAPVLGHPGVLPALADYIVAADKHEWSGWQGPRANILGYRRIYEFVQPQAAP